MASSASGACFIPNHLLTPILRTFLQDLNPAAGYDAPFIPSPVVEIISAYAQTLDHDRPSITLFAVHWSQGLDDTLTQSEKAARAHARSEELDRNALIQQLFEAYQALNTPESKVWSAETAAMREELKSSPELFSTDAHAESDPWPGGDGHRFRLRRNEGASRMACILRAMPSQQLATNGAKYGELLKKVELAAFFRYAPMEDVLHRWTTNQASRRKIGLAVSVTVDPLTNKLIHDSWTCGRHFAEGDSDDDLEEFREELRALPRTPGTMHALSLDPFLPGEDMTEVEQHAFLQHLRAKLVHEIAVQAVGDEEQIARAKAYAAQFDLLGQPIAACADTGGRGQPVSVVPAELAGHQNPAGMGTMPPGPALFPSPMVLAAATATAVPQWLPQPMVFSPDHLRMHRPPDQQDPLRLLTQMYLQQLQQQNQSQQQLRPQLPLMPHSLFGSQTHPPPPPAQ